MRNGVKGSGFTPAQKSLSQHQQGQKWSHCLDKEHLKKHLLAKSPAPERQVGEGVFWAVFRGKGTGRGWVAAGGQLGCCGLGRRGAFQGGRGLLLL